MTDSKILVVDDEPFILKSLVFVLKKHGHGVYSAADGQEGLEKIKKYRPDIVFLDVMMPKMDGYTVCREVKNDPELKNTYIIMLTAKGRESEMDKALKLGANEYMSKPFSPARVIEGIDNILSSKDRPKNTSS